MMYFCWTISFHFILSGMWRKTSQESRGSQLVIVRSGTAYMIMSLKNRSCVEGKKENVRVIKNVCSHLLLFLKSTAESFFFLLSDRSSQAASVHCTFFAFLQRKFLPNYCKTTLDNWRQDDRWRSYARSSVFVANSSLFALNFVIGFFSEYGIRILFRMRNINYLTNTSWINILPIVLPLVTLI